MPPILYEVGGIFVGSLSLKVRTPAFQVGNAGFKSRGDHILIRLLSLKVRTSASQAGDVGFKSRRSYCGHRTVVVRQIVALLTGVRFPLVTPRMGMPSGEGSGL